MSEAADATATPGEPTSDLAEHIADPATASAALDSLAQGSSGTPAPRPDRELIVRFRGVGKAFRLYDQKPFLLRNLLRRIVGGRSKPKEFWPLRDITFDIARRETVGVIGQNGSGKSTLLRLMAGAAYPTTGHIAVRGRVAPLLALGAGFQPDMSGRECVQVNGTALGLSPEEIESRMDAIVSFAELAGFIDAPVRYYSSGMLARLGFAVAVHTSPDLLLIDEVLAVGDHSFQQKCIARIHEIQQAGTTILFVSHDAHAVQTLCNRVLWLRDGRLHRDGPPGPIIQEYLQATH